MFLERKVYLMPFVKTRDHTSLFYQEWGTGEPMLFVHGWCLGADMWEYQMAPLVDEGLRCVAYDVRGCGRSDRPGSGYDFDTLTDDMAVMIDHLDLRGVTLVGHSMGAAQVVRYLARHGSDRVARVALVSMIPPFSAKTEDNPDGADESVLAGMVAALYDDRARWASDIAPSWFGDGLPGVSVSAELLDWGVRLFLEASLRAAVELQRASFATDLRPDTRAVAVPTLVVHGDSDSMVPFETSSRKVAGAITNAELKVYENASHGLFVSHKARLNRDLLSFSGLRKEGNHAQEQRKAPVQG
jgi:pimeloyl-ACP methyl ester carboxylesterase